MGDAKLALKLEKTIFEFPNAAAFGVPYGNRTRVAAVKEKRFTGIQRKPAAWIAP